MKMNPNYTRPQPDELVKSKTGYNGFFETPSSEHQIKDNGVEPTETEEKDLLICCPTVPGFGLEDKMWCMVVSLLQCGSCQSNPLR